jgi:hypothetical protein
MPPTLSPLPVTVVPLIDEFRTEEVVRLPIKPPTSEVPLNVFVPVMLTPSIVELTAVDASKPEGPLGAAPEIFMLLKLIFLMVAPERVPNKPPGVEVEPPAKVMFDTVKLFPSSVPLNESSRANNGNCDTPLQSILLVSL